MIKKEDIKADLHVHTIGSLHGYSTLKECIDSAAINCMRYIACSIVNRVDTIFKENYMRTVA